jgi:predicted GH43/DUF377 family glycosyl hydrolase
VLIAAIGFFGFTVRVNPNAYADINYKWSADGITGWTDGPYNPVLGDYQGAGAMISGYFDNATSSYRIVYEGTNMNQPGFGWTECVCQASIAAPPPAPSGALTRYSGNPLIANGPELYDYVHAGPHTVLKMGPTDYRMWYEAILQSNNYTTVAYATSTDGLSWTKYASNPVMSPDGMNSWEKGEVSPNSVLYEDGIFKMYYHGGGYVTPDKPNTRQGGAYIGYATSPDGINWTKYSGNPVLSPDPSSSYDSNQCSEPRVFNLSTLGLGTGYRMYYSSQNLPSTTMDVSLSMATSPDGINWTKHAGNPLIPTSIFGNGWGGAFFPNADGSWYLWHSAPGGTSINFASSPDGINWTEGSNNPVLSNSSSSADPDYAGAGMTVNGYLDGTTYRILYLGSSSVYPPFSGRLIMPGRFSGICLATISAPAVLPPPHSPPGPPLPLALPALNYSPMGALTMGSPAWCSALASSFAFFRPGLNFRCP